MLLKISDPGPRGNAGSHQNTGDNRRNGIGTKLVCYRRPQHEHCYTHGAAANQARLTLFDPLSHA
jgi:hypothetical protein